MAADSGQVYIGNVDAVVTAGYNAETRQLDPGVERALVDAMVNEGVQRERACSVVAERVQAIYG